MCSWGVWLVHACIVAIAIIKRVGRWTWNGDAIGKNVETRIAASSAAADEHDWTIQMQQPVSGQLRWSVELRLTDQSTKKLGCHGDVARFRAI